MTDLAEFLLARITEDEKASRQSMPGPWTSVPDRGVPGTRHSIWSSGGGYDIAPAVINGPTAEYIARWDPPRMAAECKAKRQIVEPWGDDPGEKVDWLYGIHAAAREHILKMLALPYADHPDYRPEWRP